MRTQNTHPVHREVMYGFALVALMLAGGTGWWNWQTTKPTTVNQKPIATQPEKVNPKVITPQAAQRLNSKLTLTTVQLRPQIYWLQIADNKIHLTPQQITVKSGVTAEVALREALNNLLSIPQTSTLTSTIPVGTRLLSLQVTPDGIYVNLSSEFKQGGGSTSMTYRVAQIIYTATSLDPQAQVFISVDGQRIDADHPLGGEGIILRQPITRKQFLEDFDLARN
ncbi:MAG: GerMN domain-containing protein [Goleter apudmare HA4340-LM2]|nr:GerMN domain-containing protein [Goleter apudmare HA4340-LM2]